jgi:hypothetical protein
MAMEQTGNITKLIPYIEIMGNGFTIAKNVMHASFLGNIIEWIIGWIT